MCEQPRNSALCPECGNPGHDPAAPPPPPRRPIAAALIAFGLLLGIHVFVMVRTARTSPPRTGTPYVRASLPPHAFTPNTIAALANGAAGIEDAGNGSLARHAADLARSRSPDRPGDATLVAAYIHPGAVAKTTRTIGWPAPWVSCTSSESFDDDFYHRRSHNWGPAARLLTWSANRDTVTWSRTRRDPWTPSNSALRTTSVQFHLPNIAASAAILLLLAAAARRLTRPRHDPAPARTATRRAAVLAAVLAAAAAMALLSLRTTTELNSLRSLKGPPTQIGVVPPTDVITTAMNSAEAAALPPTAEGDAAVARAIAAASGALATPAPGAALAIGFTEPTRATSSSTVVGWPWPLLWIRRTTLTWAEGTPAAGTRAEPTTPRLGVRTERDSLHLISTRTPATQGTTTITIPPGHLLATLLAWWLAWRLLITPASLLARRRHHRRLTRNECLACGYPLPAATLTPQPLTPHPPT